MSFNLFSYDNLQQLFCRSGFVFEYSFYLLLLHAHGITPCIVKASDEDWGIREAALRSVTDCVYLQRRVKENFPASTR